MENKPESEFLNRLGEDVRDIWRDRITNYISRFPEEQREQELIKYIVLMNMSEMKLFKEINDIMSNKNIPMIIKDYLVMEETRKHQLKFL